MTIETTRDLTGPDRLRLLLPWINGEKLRETQIRDRLFDFLEPSAGVDAKNVGARGFTRVAPDFNHELFGPRAMKARALERLRQELRMVLEPGLPIWLRLGPMHFTAVRGGQYRVVVVAGHIRDVVLYQVMRLLTVEGMVVLERCPAPAPNDKSRRCNNWFITHGGRRRGRTALYCSNACRQRHHQKETPPVYKNARRKR